MKTSLSSSVKSHGSPECNLFMGKEIGARNSFHLEELSHSSH
jgi:hypothetical protein